VPEQRSKFIISSRQFISLDSPAVGLAKECFKSMIARGDLVEQQDRGSRWGELLYAQSGLGGTCWSKVIEGANQWPAAHRE